MFTRHKSVAFAWLNLLKVRTAVWSRTLATYCRIDEDGFMTVPYRRVINGFLTDEVVYLAPGDDKIYALAPPDAKVENGYLTGPLVQARRGDKFFEVST